MLDKKARIELTCPNCGNKWSERLGDMRTASVDCPSCGLTIETGEFGKGMKDVERALKRFGRGLG